MWGRFARFKLTWFRSTECLAKDSFAKRWMLENSVWNVPVFVLPCVIHKLRFLIRKNALATEVLMFLQLYYSVVIQWRWSLFVLESLLQELSFFLSVKRLTTWWRESSLPFYLYSQRGRTRVNLQHGGNVTYQVREVARQWGFRAREEIKRKKKASLAAHISTRPTPYLIC